MGVVLAKSSKIKVLLGGSEFWKKIARSSIAPEGHTKKNFHGNQERYIYVLCVSSHYHKGWGAIFMELDNFQIGAQKS